MDDFNLKSLNASKNEWASRLINILSPCIIEGYKSILAESIKMCKTNKEGDKYLMTFQNLLSRIPKWNQSIVESEKQRIIQKSNCNYLEDLITCIHIIQLKMLSTMRVGSKQKQIDIDIPKIDDFIHKVYITSARKFYQNVYLFDILIPPLQIQKNNREIEIIMNECIINTVRENIPINNILKAYLDESIEVETVENIKEEIIEKDIVAPNKTHTKTPDLKHDNTPEIKPVSSNKVVDNEIKILKTIPEKLSFSNSVGSSNNNDEPEQLLSFNDIDYTKDTNDKEHTINAPKDIKTLETISNERHQKRVDETDDSEYDDDEKLTISTDDIKLDCNDFFDIGEPTTEVKLKDCGLDVEILE